MTWWKSKSTAPPDPSPPREQLLAVARQVAAERRWLWLEPVQISLDSVSTVGRVWAVRTNCQRRGSNIRVLINEADFTVVSAGFLPR